MNETETEAEQAFAARAKQVFDESVDGLDAASLSRLNRGRQAALAEIDRPRQRWSRWTPAVGAAAVVLLAVVMLRGPAEIDVIAAPASDLEILLSEESIDMFEELEFYSWLDAADLEGTGDVG